VLNLTQETANPVVGALRLGEARDRLREGMDRLPELARRLEEPERALVAEAVPQWSLVLDHEEPPGIAIRPHLPFDSAGSPTAPRLADIMGIQSPLSQVLGPLELDPLTVADDRDFTERLTRQRNIPDYLKEALPDLF
jgi:5-methylthioadenosine/S-adenosylhomocysteine deaminase